MKRTAQSWLATVASTASHTATGTCEWSFMDGGVVTPSQTCSFQTARVWAARDVLFHHPVSVVELRGPKDSDAALYFDLDHVSPSELARFQTTLLRFLPRWYTHARHTTAPAPDQDDATPVDQVDATLVLTSTCVDASGTVGAHVVVPEWIVTAPQLKWFRDELVQWEPSWAAMLDPQPLQTSLRMVSMSKAVPCKACDTKKKSKMNKRKRGVEAKVETAAGTVKPAGAGVGAGAGTERQTWKWCNVCQNTGVLHAQDRRHDVVSVLRWRRRVDMGTDVGTDVGTDTGADVGTDTGTGMDADVGTGTGTGTDAGADVGTGTGMDADAGTDASTDTSTSAGMDVGIDSREGWVCDTEATVWAQVCPEYALFLTHIRRHGDACVGRTVKLTTVRPSQMTADTKFSKNGSMSMSAWQADTSSKTDANLLIKWEKSDVVTVASVWVDRFQPLVSATLPCVYVQYAGVRLSRIQYQIRTGGSGRHSKKSGTGTGTGTPYVMLTGRLASSTDALSYCPYFQGNHTTNEIVLDMHPTGMRIRCFSIKSGPDKRKCVDACREQTYLSAKDMVAWKCAIRDLYTAYALPLPLGVGMGVCIATPCSTRSTVDSCSNADRADRTGHADHFENKPNMNRTEKSTNIACGGTSANDIQTRIRMKHLYNPLFSNRTLAVLSKSFSKR